MNTTPEAVPSTQSFLDALADVAAARQSKAGAFVWVHGHSILACVREGYFASQIYRALDALGFHPPMSERQFRRYVRQMKPHQGLTTNSPRRRRQIVSSPDIAPVTKAPGAMHGPLSTPRPLERQPPHSGPTTFDWDPTQDVDDLR